MNEAKFTKGEWLGFIDGKWQSDYINDYVLDGDNNPSWVQITCNGQAVAIIPNHGNTLDENAHLIAAAPKMYDFLDELVDGCLDESDNDRLIKLLGEARGNLL